MNAKQRKAVDERIVKGKRKFLEILEKSPVIAIACERSGVSKATFFRWKDADKEFVKKVESAMSEGNSLISDIARAQLISLVKEKNFAGIKFWLQNKDPEFRPRIEVEGQMKVIEQLSPEEEALLRRALHLVALPIQTSKFNQPA
jgi:hypothetical protein